MLYIFILTITKKQIQMTNKSTPLSESHKLYSSNANHLTFQNATLHQKNYKQSNTSYQNLYSKSYVFDKEANKKEELGLRKTINYDKQVFQSNSKKNINAYLRNTLNSACSEKDKPQNMALKMEKSVINKAYDEIGYTALKSTASSIKEQKSKQANYLNIIQKLSKKQKLINQLKELSKINITDNIRRPQQGQAKNNKFNNNNIIQQASRVQTNYGTNMNQTQVIQRDIYDSKKYDYSPAYHQKGYQSKKLVSQGEKSIKEIHQHVKKDIVKATSSYLPEKQSKTQYISPTKNLYKSKFENSPSNNEEYKPFYNSNVYYTPKQVKNQQNLKIAVKKLDLSGFNSPQLHNEQSGKKYYQANYKINRYKQTFSEPNTPLLVKSSNKTAKNMVDVNKKQDFYGNLDEGYNYKTFSYLGANNAEPNTPLIKKTQQNKPYKGIQDIRTTVERRFQANSNYFAIGKPPKIYDFQLTKELGQGKFGTVYQAIHKQTSTIYALKKLSKKNIKDNLMIDQLVKEIKIQSFCNHENILRLYGFFDDLQNIYLILQYMEEGTLFQHFKKQKTFTEKQTAVKINQIAQGIKYLHQNGITHRDIKPENIVLSHGIGKLCDFGWATLCNGRRNTYCGTFDYVAPQILQGEQYDETVDLWCLGILAYELLVGKAPFYHLSRKQTMKRILNVQNQTIQYPSHLSKQTISFIESLIRKKPEERMNGKQIMNHPFIVNANTQ